MRFENRSNNATREIQFQRHFTKYAEGSVLASMGNTKVLCNASVSTGVPRFLKDKGQGWLTAEYSMLPRATHDRCQREAARGKQGGRTLEIQRLIGRSLRAAIDLKLLGEYTINIDCDVIQADGGTRCTAISGACVALVDALRTMQRNKQITTDPLKHMIAAISVGILHDELLLDLDYSEDSQAHTDMNLVMTNDKGIIEIQGTAEGEVFSQTQLTSLVGLAETGIEQILQAQKAVLAK